MSGKAAKVKCTEKQIEVLEQIIKSTRSELRLIVRANIIWPAFYGKRNEKIAEIVGLWSRNTLDTARHASLETGMSLNDLRRRSLKKLNS